MSEEHKTADYEFFKGHTQCYWPNFGSVIALPTTGHFPFAVRDSTIQGHLEDLQKISTWQVRLKHTRPFPICYIPIFVSKWKKLCRHEFSPEEDQPIGTHEDVKVLHWWIPSSLRLEDLETHEQLTEWSSFRRCVTLGTLFPWTVLSFCFLGWLILSLNMYLIRSH